MAGQHPALWLVPLASFHLQPRSPSRMAAVGLAHQRAQTWHPRRGTYRFLSDGWIFLCHSPGQPHLLGTMREQWPLPTFPGLRTTPLPPTSQVRSNIYFPIWVSLPNNPNLFGEGRVQNFPETESQPSWQEVGQHPGVRPSAESVPCSAHCPPAAEASSSDEVLVDGPEFAASLGGASAPGQALGVNATLH